MTPTVTARCGCGAELDVTVHHDDTPEGDQLCETCCPTCTPTEQARPDECPNCRSDRPHRSKFLGPFCAHPWHLLSHPDTPARSRTMSANYPIGDRVAASSERERATADRIEVLERAIRDALPQLDDEHAPLWLTPEMEAEGRDPIGCRMCFPGDGSWPCVTRMVADDLAHALADPQLDADRRAAL